MNVLQKLTVKKVVKNAMDFLTKQKLLYLSQHVTKFLCNQEKRAYFKSTVGYFLKKWNKTFEDNNIPEPNESIVNILIHVLGTQRIADTNKILTEDQIYQINALSEKRMKRMPIQYILGEWEFRELTLKMYPPVFIPRPETEMLVDIVLREIDNRSVDSVLELCCGSGAVSLSLLKERPKLQVIAVDQSEQACILTQMNAKNLGLAERLRIFQSRIRDGNNLSVLKGQFDIIVSNPPYILSKNLHLLQPEIKLFEDIKALDGGEDGLDVIKPILNLSSRSLSAGGKLILEVDPVHPEMLRSLIENTNLTYLNTYEDFCGKSRFVEIMKN